ncbi:anion permease [bacterium]|nr:anion permease [bacterium]MBU1994750.1 anion permease [bacterium]
MAKHPQQKIDQHYLQLIIFSLGVLLWFTPVPEGLRPEAWQLLSIFIVTILSVIIKALSLFTSSILALSVAVLTGLLTPEQAYSGFSEDFILLILVALLIARGVIKSGLGKRIAFIIIKKIGKSSLGLSYSIILADIFIAPAFPSNTARSGVLYPIINALAHDNDSRVADGTRKKLGSFLMMSSMAGLTLSSTLWLTAMVANPAGAAMAKKFGIEITFASWALAASLPVIILFLLIPWLICKVYPPEVKQTPEAPIIAQDVLLHMGKFHKNEWIMSITFILIVFLWSMSEYWGINKTAVALLGVGILMMTNIFTLDDMKQEGGALETLIWFAILFTLSAYLNKFGFMEWAGTHISDNLIGFSWPIVYVGLIIGYVLMHYFFVSQTAHMLALFGIFLETGINAGVPGELMALMLLFATNFSAIIAPQGSSANVIFAGSGYMEADEIYKIGGIITAVNTFIFLTLGTSWILLIM